jgi:hypothetical protein
MLTIWDCHGARPSLSTRARTAGNCQKRSINALHMPDEVRLDAIACLPDRATFQQGFGRNTQDGLDKIYRRVTPERMVEPLAKTYPGRCRMMHG